MKTPEQDPLDELLDNIATWALGALLAFITTGWIAFLLGLVMGGLE